MGIFRNALSVLLSLGAAATGQGRERPTKEELRKRLTPLQFSVTQEDATEPSFNNEYWNNKEDGLYVDIVDDTPLFSSRDKFDSGTGWPSFTRPVSTDAVVLKEDRKLFVSRTEVRSRKADSHLGHVFDDGPPPLGKRFCINSASLKFVPKSQLESAGLGKFAGLFSDLKGKGDGVKSEKAIFAGGCFWCVEKDFQDLPGVIEVTSGYIGGKTENPTYQQVSSGSTGHTEAVEVIFDPQVVSYDALVSHFWRQIDPLNPNGQFCDSGNQYRSAIYTMSDAQAKIAQESRKNIENVLQSHGKINTEILAAGKFFPAEEYHQDYAKKNPIRYQLYRRGCGRDKRLQEIWGTTAKSKD